MKSSCAVLIALLIAGVAAFGQSGSADPEFKNVFYQSMPAPPPGAVAAGDMTFFHAEMSDHGAPVTGAPYTATAVTEMTQTLADGNRIVNKSTASVARDSQGRTRREEVLGSLGPWHMNGPKLTFIHDPVAHTDYVLDANDHSARVLKGGRMHALMLHGEHGPWHMITTQQHAVALTQDEGGKAESLGTQSIGGVAAEGKRVTRTIPAGQIGNERPLEITSETWYSPDLKMVVLSKHFDPRFGETSYQVTDVRRGEPDASLFKVPAGYAVKQGPPAPPPLPK